MFRLGFLPHLLLLGASACLPAAVPPAVPPAIPSLVAGRRVGGGIRPGETRPFRCSLRRGEFMRAELAQNGADLSVTVLAPGGATVADIDAFEYGAESVSVIAGVSGEYRLVVHSGGHGAGAYELEMQELRPAGPGDEKRIAAERLSTEAKRLMAAPTADALRDALGLNRDALQLWTELAEPAAQSRTLVKIGDILYARSRYEEAMHEYQGALAIAEAATDRRTIAEAHNNIGACHLALGAVEDARNSLLSALAGWRALHFEIGEASTAENLGLLAWETGDLEESLQFHTQALAVFRRLSERQSTATALSNTALVYSSLNKPELALKYLIEASRIFRALHDRSREGRNLISIGHVELLLNRNADAMASLKRAVELFRDSPDVRGTANAMTNLAHALGTDERDEALRLYGGALELYRRIGDRPGQASVLYGLGVGDARAGERARAIEELESSFRLRTDAGIREAAAETLFQMSRVYESMGELDNARQRLSDALDLVESMRLEASGEELRSSYFASKQSYYRSFVDLLMRQGRTAEAFAAAERSMARNLTDVLYEGRSRIAGGRLDPALLERQRNLERRLNFKSQQLIRAAREKPDAQRDAALRTEVEELLADGGAVEAEIRDKDPQYADLWRPRIASLEEVQSLLGRGTVLVEFFLGDRNGYLWAVTADSVESFTLPGRAELEKASRPALELAGAYRRRASNPALQSALNRALARTSDMLLRPLTPYLTRPRWIVVGDGPIQYLPFAALPIPGRPQVTLGARREITSLPSASTLVALRREPAPLRTASKTAAVFADPVFDGLDPRVEKTAVLDNRRQPDPPAWNLARLPFSRVEADAIAALVPARSLLMATGFSANKRALTNPRIGEYRILHISAHTMLNDSVPELSGLALSQVDGRGNAVDGFLRLYEIYKLRLSDTELVVLSACKTGLGREVLGEGLISLARGFLYAGARRVLVSLWEVDDQATAELMSRFYRGMLGNSRMRPAAALEAAQSSMRMDSRWRDPYFWAGFVLVSDEE